MVDATERAPLVRRRVLIAIFLLWWITPIDTLRTSAAAGEQQQETPVGLEDQEFVEPLTEPLAVIPPGREDFLAEMLGRGAALPGQCAFTGGKVERDTVVATYTCPNGEVAFSLRHPRKAIPDAKLSEQFAISVQSGSPPAGLAEELESRIRSRESAFEWTWLAATATPQSSRAIVVIIGVLLATAALWLALRRRT